MYRMVCGDARQVLREVEPVACCVTSPPYWGLRDYKTEPLVWGGEEGCAHEWGSRLAHGRRGNRGVSGTGGNLYPTLDASGAGPGSGGGGEFCVKCGAWRGSLGLEPTPEMYVQHLVEIFRDVRRVLRADGTLFLNLGDSYANQGGAHGGRNDNQTGVGAKRTHLAGGGDQNCRFAPAGLKPKDLIGIPWRVALALQADGWWRSHEYMFLLAKSERYRYDADAIAEPCVTNPKENYPARAKITGRGTQGAADARGGDRDKSGGFPPKQDRVGNRTYDGFNAWWDDAEANGTTPALRNRRDVWTIATRPYRGAHFATFPPALVEPCILAGCPPGGTVLDPFAGAGTTLVVAERLGRNSVGIELNPEYVEMAERRLGMESGKNMLDKTPSNPIQSLQGQN